MPGLSIFGFLIGLDTVAGECFRFRILVPWPKCFDVCLFGASAWRVAFNFFQFAESSILVLSLHAETYTQVEGLLKNLGLADKYAKRKLSTSTKHGRSYSVLQNRLNIPNLTDLVSHLPVSIRKVIHKSGIRSKHERHATPSLVTLDLVVSSSMAQDALGGNVGVSRAPPKKGVAKERSANQHR
jgi:hypothetical protein